MINLFIFSKKKNSNAKIKKTKVQKCDRRASWRFSERSSKCSDARRSTFNGCIDTRAQVHFAFIYLFVCLFVCLCVLKEETKRFLNFLLFKSTSAPLNALILVQRAAPRVALATRTGDAIRAHAQRKTDEKRFPRMFDVLFVPLSITERIFFLFLKKKNSCSRCNCF